MVYPSPIVAQLKPFIYGSLWAAMGYTESLYPEYRKKIKASY